MKRIEMISIAQKAVYITNLETHMEMLRVKAALTQSELSQLAGFSRGVYGMVISGKSHLSWRNFLALLYVFEHHNATKELLWKLDIYPKEFVQSMNREVMTIE